ncbi:gp15 domain protein [Mycobacterium xenopi 3993]|nr:gp15 domain protein [Mycobacterium xenopi 3993]
MFLRTDPRKRGAQVQDLTVVPPTPQQLNSFQQALVKFESFAFANNIPPLLQTINSLFGIKPPQGNMYSLLKGRFSNRAAIPPSRPATRRSPTS